MGHVTLKNRFIGHFDRPPMEYKNAWVGWAKISSHLTVFLNEQESIDSEELDTPSKRDGAME